MKIDGKGIQPDFYLDSSIPAYQWVSYTWHVRRDVIFPVLIRAQVTAPALPSTAVLGAKADLWVTYSNRLSG